MVFHFQCCLICGFLEFFSILKFIFFHSLLLLGLQTNNNNNKYDVWPYLALFIIIINCKTHITCIQEWLNDDDDDGNIFCNPGTTLPCYTRHDFFLIFRWKKKKLDDDDGDGGVSFPHSTTSFRLLNEKKNPSMMMMMMEIQVFEISLFF